MKESAPIWIKKVLEEMPVGEVEYFANLAKGKDIKILVDHTKRLIDIEKNRIFAMSEKDPQALAIEKAHSRGKVAGLMDLVYIINGAVLEIEKRLKK